MYVDNIIKNFSILAIMKKILREGKKSPMINIRVHRKMDVAISVKHKTFDELTL